MSALDPETTGRAERFTNPSGVLAFLGAMLVGCLVATVAHFCGFDPAKAFGAFLVFLGFFSGAYEAVRG